MLGISFLKLKKGLLKRENIIKLIKKSGLPVIPVYFDGTNSRLFHWLGRIHPRLRTLRLPREMFNKRGTHPRLGIGEIISVEEQEKHTDLQDFKDYLRHSVYDMPLPESFVKRSELWK